MSSLLLLPRELRDCIIDYCLLYAKVPPEPPGNDLNATAYDRIALRGHIGDERQEVIYSQKSSYVPAWTNLLQVCHQLCAETLARIAANRSQYLLDIMFVNESVFWPTWLQIPPQITGENDLVDRLDINIRLCGAFEPGKGLSSAVEEATMGAELESFVLHFLRYGARGLFNQDSEALGKLRYGIRTLRINVDPEAYLHPEQVLDEEEDWIRREYGSPSAMNPRAFFGYLQHQIEYVWIVFPMSTSYPPPLDIAASVGSIELTFGGQTSKRWDLAEWFHQPLRELSPEKQIAINRRRALGLEIAHV